MQQKAVAAAGGNWVEKNIREFRGSPTQRIGEGWMLITAGNVTGTGDGAGPGCWNTMTASWGGLGIVWNKDAAFAFVRPSRHTRSFVDANPLFTLSFFDEERRDALAFCGEKSGRDCDKAASTGLTPIVFGGGMAGGRVAGAVSFREASDIIVCRKLYTHDIDPSRFLAPEIAKNYPEGDYHRLYVGEVLALLTGK
ncbi:MAG: flavin reductase family protein [Treponema sp.]|jgi:flavin reductase (DIM6/NTAB) family NADH-FMN oxidoreductase RutF|nr:flavin reductase family protein [Treponema sp.]